MRYSDLAGPVAPSSTAVFADLDPDEPAVSGADGRGGQSSNRLREISKDKILRQSPFDACGLILAGRRNDFNERFNSFFIGKGLYLPPPSILPS